MTQDQLNKLDYYHSGRMTGSEARAFEKEIQYDPDLMAESDMQSQIVEGLREYRKAELKARMDAIHIGPSWIAFIQQSTLVKSLGGVMVASFIGGAIWMYGDHEADSEIFVKNDTFVATVEENSSTDFVLKLGEEKLSDRSFLTNNESIKEPANPVNVTSGISTGAVGAAIDQTIEAAKEPSKETFVPNFNAPQAADIVEEDDFTSEALDMLPESATKKKDGVVDVKSEINKSTRIKYKYYDGKLYLVGDFNRAPYEILEINSPKDRRIYIYYLENYYHVGITDRLKELPKVTNVQLLEELALIRANK